MTRSKNNISQTFKETYEALLVQLNDPAIFQLYAEMTMKHVMVTRELNMVHNKQASQDRFTCVLIYDGPSSVAPSAPPPAASATATVMNSRFDNKAIDNTRINQVSTFQLYSKRKQKSNFITGRRSYYIESIL
ncbi:hypothetical protein PS15m_001643 [Mucor circinelloides]